MDATPTAIGLQTLLTGLSSPVLATNAGDGSNRLFVVQQGGIIRVLQPGAASTTNFLNISSIVNFGGEQGLLGLAFHPDYANNGRFFVHYTQTGGANNIIAEYRVSATDPNVADPTSGQILMVIPQPFSNHNGGSIEFGRDGYLYIAKGDGGSANDPGNRAQNLGILNGKILRIDVDSGDDFPADPNRNYHIPASNPFVGVPGAAPEVYAYGLRNPYRFSFDRQAGLVDRLIVADVGQNAREEIDYIVAGGNYGWRGFEGTRVNIGTDPIASNPGATIFPIAQYGAVTPGGGRSVTGGYVYRGSLGTLPTGAYIFGDYITSQLFLLYNGVQTTLTTTVSSPSSFGQDEDGELYVVSYGGTLFRITRPTSGNTNPDIRIIDDGGANFSPSANFIGFPFQGFGNDVHYAESASTLGSTETALWTFNGLSAGTYRVSATWSEHPNRATNSPFTVYDGTTLGTSLGTFLVNQELAPGTFIENGIRWLDLGTGTFTITGGTLTVRLQNLANEYVIADAIRVERVGASGTAQAVVQQGLTPIADITVNNPFSVYDFGNTATGTPVDRVFTVKNLGNATLTLGPVSASGTGFSVFTPLSSTSLAPGASATFTIRMNSGSAAVLSGSVSFTTNDPDSATYNYTVVGSTGGATSVTIIDDGDPGYTQTGLTSIGGQGFNGDVSFAAAGTGFVQNTAFNTTSTGYATYTFTGLTPGLYRVSATWTADPNRATNTPFTVYDGTPGTNGSTLLDTVRINQELAPNDFTASSVGWKNLGGPYFITTGTIVVRVANDANEFIIADAIRVERLATNPVQIIDDSSPSGFTATGAFTPFQFQGFNNNVTFDLGTLTPPHDTATWTFAVVPGGVYKVSITWTPFPNRATNAPFSVSGVTAPATISVNQEQAPADFQADGFGWRILGNFTATGSTLTVQLSTQNANEYVIADAVRIERLA